MLGPAEIFVAKLLTVCGTSLVLAVTSGGFPASVNDGASLMALTVTASVSLSVSTPPPAVPPLSCTDQVRLPVPLAFATVLYLRPCSSASVSVSLTATAVVPSALKTLMNAGIAVNLKVSV